VAEQAVGGSAPLSSTRFQAWGSADHAAYELHQGSPSAPSTSGLAAYDKLFGGELMADNAEALDELFSG
jgi:hypothetical protein